MVNTSNNTSGDINELLNWSTPFGDQKVGLLDQVVAAMYGANSA